MKLDFLDHITAPKKADPKQVRKKQIKSRKIHISMKTVISVFAVFIVLLTLVSVYTVVKERSEKQQTQQSEQNPDESAEQAYLDTASTSLQNDVSFKSNLLVGFTKEDTKGLRLLAVISADSESTSGIKISYIPVDFVCNANNHETDMKGHLENGGITELLWAVESTYAIDISRYIYCDESDFVDIMKYVGEIPVKVEKDVNYSYNGINFIIEEGTQQFTADMFLKYFTYLCDTYDENTLKLTEMMMLFAKNLISFDDEKTPESTYDKLVNYVITDISAMDISNYSPALRSIIEDGGLENAEIVSLASDFSQTSQISE
ncbi:MAG: LCP family protein [Acutalibacteraceae bacterium]